MSQMSASRRVAERVGTARVWNGQPAVIAVTPSSADRGAMTRTEQLEAPKEVIGATTPLTARPSVTDHAKRRGVGPVVVLTLGGAVVAALLMVAVVFAGATESVITSATLLCFALGWTGLWWFSRRTDDSQPWAAVPAAFMATGAALTTVFGAGGSNFGWLWPPALIVLVVWMSTRVRRQLPGRTRRWVVYPLLVVMTAAAIAGAAETGIEYAQSSSPSTGAGRLVDVGGRRLHLDCSGTGSPVVVLQAGLGGTGTEIGAWIAPSVSTATRVCSYDRAGRGSSDDAGHPQTSDEVVADLHRLLIRSGEHGPFVFAGHSEGGAYVMNYAHRYPSEVAGVVLLDSMHPEQATRIEGWLTIYDGMRRATALFPSLARLGVARVMMQSSYGDLPAAARAELRRTGSTARQARSLRDETSQVLGTLDAAKKLETLGATPLIVVSATKGSLPGWPAAQVDLATVSTNSSHRAVAQATHADLVDAQAAARHSSDAILDVIEAVRSNTEVG
jgi:pimeloyl-ACP methyl ester carboxylesterase